MPRPRKYASDAERQRAYRDRQREANPPECHAETILPKRLLYALAAYAVDQDRFDRMVAAICGADDRLQRIYDRLQRPEVAEQMPQDVQAKLAAAQRRSGRFGPD